MVKVDWSVEGPGGIMFFGRVTASISHELKNALAIVNENAGLLEDFVLMAEKGMDIDPDRLAEIAGRISGQIGRADRIVGNLNSFAHSVDQQFCTVDMFQSVELTVAVVSRIVAMKGLAVVPERPAEEVKLNTSPFLLQHLVSTLLFIIAESVSGSAEISLQMEQADQGAVLTLVSVAGEVGWGDVDLQGNSSVAVLLDSLNASVELIPEKGTAILRLGQVPAA